MGLSMENRMNKFFIPFLLVLAIMITIVGCSPVGENPQNSDD